MAHLPGDKVFAKIKGFSNWPARINPLPPGVQIPKGKLPVFFYGTYQVSFVPVKNIVPYEKFKDKWGKPKSNPQFMAAMREIETTPGIFMLGEDPKAESFLSQFYDFEPGSLDVQSHKHNQSWNATHCSDGTPKHLMGSNDESVSQQDSPQNSPSTNNDSIGTHQSVEKYKEEEEQTHKYLRPKKKQHAVHESFRSIDPNGHSEINFLSDSSSDVSSERTRTNSLDLAQPNQSDEDTNDTVEKSHISLLKNKQMNYSKKQQQQDHSSSDELDSHYRENREARRLARKIQKKAEKKALKKAAKREAKRIAKETERAEKRARKEAKREMKRLHRLEKQRLVEHENSLNNEFKSHSDIMDSDFDDHDFNTDPNTEIQADQHQQIWPLPSLSNTEISIHSLTKGMDYHSSHMRDIHSSPLNTVNHPNCDDSDPVSVNTHVEDTVIVSLNSTNTSNKRDSIANLKRLNVDHYESNNDIHNVEQNVNDYSESSANNELISSKRAKLSSNRDNLMKSKESENLSDNKSNINQNEFDLFPKISPEINKPKQSHDSDSNSNHENDNIDNHNKNVDKTDENDKIIVKKHQTSIKTISSDDSDSDNQLSISSKTKIKSSNHKIKTPTNTTTANSNNHNSQLKTNSKSLLNSEHNSTIDQNNHTKDKNSSLTIKKGKRLSDDSMTNAPMTDVHHNRHLTSINSEKVSQLHHFCRDLKASLVRGHENFQTAVHLLGELCHFSVRLSELAQAWDLMDCIKKCRRYKLSAEVREAAQNTFRHFQTLQTNATKEELTLAQSYIAAHQNRNQKINDLNTAKPKGPAPTPTECKISSNNHDTVPDCAPTVTEYSQKDSSKEHEDLTADLEAKVDDVLSRIRATEERMAAAAASSRSDSTNRSQHTHSSSSSLRASNSMNYDGGRVIRASAVAAAAAHIREEEDEEAVMSRVEQVAAYEAKCLVSSDSALPPPPPPPLYLRNSFGDVEKRHSQYNTSLPTSSPVDLDLDSRIQRLMTGAISYVVSTQSSNPSSDPTEIYKKGINSHSIITPSVSSSTSSDLLPALLAKRKVIADKLAAVRASGSPMKSCHPVTSPLSLSPTENVIELTEAHSKSIKSDNSNNNHSKDEELYDLLGV